MPVLRSAALGILVAAAALCGPVLGHAATLTFRFNDGEEKEMRQALDLFEKENPGAKVTLQRTNWRDARDQFLRESAVGQGPDVVHIAFVWAKEMGEAEALLPLDPLMKKAPLASGFDDFIATDLATGKDGKVYALPWTTDTWAMVYRTDLLKQAGIDKLPETWAELHDASAAVAKATGKAGFGFPAGSSASGSIWFLANYYWWSNGKALVVRKDDGSFAMNIAAADVAEAMRYYKSFLDEGHAPKSMLAVSDWGDPAIVQALAKGDQAIGIMPPNTLRQVVDAYKAANPGQPVPIVSGPVPKGTVTRSSHLGGRMLGVNSNTKEPDLAWKLVQFLASKPIFTTYYTSQFPAQKVLLKEVAFSPEMKGVAEQLGYARTWGAYADGPAPIGAMWNATGRAFGAALSGQRSPDDAAGDLVREIAKLMQTKG